jgi:hypothetical protein
LLEHRNLLVQDEIQARQPAEAWWFMHTPATINLEKNGRIATLQQNGKTLRAEILSPSTASFEAMSAEPLASSPHPREQAINKGIRKLAIHLAGTTNTRLAVLLVPITPKETNQTEAPKLKGLDQW